MVALLALGCGGATRAPEPSAPEARERARTEALEGGDALFAERGLVGAFVVRRVGGIDRVIGGERVDARFVPASTFKIPNTLIGLETGVIPDASFTLPWDGQERAIAAWNQDHDLRGAIQESVVWWYQELARRVGHERMRELVRGMRFGNADIGDDDAIDRFWLEGPLAISPREQIEFLSRLTRGELPVSARSVAILREVISSEARGEVVVRWKTGTHQIEDGSGHAWLVGWIEDGGETSAHFALILLAGDNDELASHMSARRPLVMELLEREGLVPPA